MKRARTTTLALMALLLGVASAASAQSPRQALEELRDGRLRLEFETREDVWGNGRNIHTGHHSHDSDWISDCEPGPGRIQLEVRDGRIEDVEFRVGGRWRSTREGDVDIGRIASGEAADFLLELATRPGPGERDGLVFAATTARGFEDWSRLLGLARDDDLDEDVREESVFWLGQAAAGEATRGLVELVDDEDEDLQIREHAIFALSQQESDVVIGALTRVARESRHPQLRESAFFWLAQHDDPRVLDFFEDVLLEN